MTDSEGLLARDFLADNLMVPTSVTIRGDALVWSVALMYDTGMAARVPTTPATVPLLDRFLRLTEGDAGKVLRFAKKWGVWDFSFDSLRLGGMNMGGDTAAGEEKLELWYSHARQARALVNIAARAHLHEPGAPEDWRAALTSGTGSISPTAPLLDTMHKRNWQDGCRRVELEVAKWLHGGAVTPRFRWDPNQPGGPTITLSSMSLIGALGIQMAVAVSRAGSLAFCAGCGNVYTPQYKPRAGKRNYCLDCGKKAARRDASRDFRQRQKQGALE